MLLPLIVGRSSADEAYTVDLVSLPHLFIAYSYPSQLQYLLNHLMTTLLACNNNSPILFDISFSRQVADALDNDILVHIRNKFIVNELEETNTGSKSEFLTSLNKEMKRRVKLLSTKRFKTIKEYNEADKNKIPYLIVCLEDVLSLAISNKKSLGLMFVNLILTGPSVGIHFIAATTSSFRNLLTQLVYIHPSILKQLEIKEGNNNLKMMPPLGAELVITPDELYFLRKREREGFERLFKV